jgi:hypothetical protein
MDGELSTLIPYYVCMLDAMQLAFGPRDDVNKRLTEIEERMETREDYYNSLAAFYDVEWLQVTLAAVDRGSPIHPDIEMPSVDEILIEFDKLFQ